MRQIRLQSDGRQSLKHIPEQLEEEDEGMDVFQQQTGGVTEEKTSREDVGIDQEHILH